ncbi:hypothetical protein PR048_026190 [Dryococelus australis]|uniref:Uncharacterized protein n=1 Tax=Dryococelus australis TaxID=614101 RepID=A0ABQ9GKN3_9NEOP|nr:hypothetical protein PR048_026190 [Dryococelus australis]
MGDDSDVQTDKQWAKQKLPAVSSLLGPLPLFLRLQPSLLSYLALDWVPVYLVLQLRCRVYTFSHETIERASNALIYEINLHTSDEGCTSLASSGDGALYVRSNIALIASALLGLKRGRKLRLEGEGILNKITVSHNAKLRHYNTVVLPEALYEAETTMIRGMTKIHDIEKQERKILTKTREVVLRDGTWFRRPTKDLYENTDTITDKFRKRRLQFYGHLFRKGEDRLKKNIFNIVNASKSNINCMKETQEDLERLKISEEEIKDRKKFRNIIRNKKTEQDPKKEMIGRSWTEERKKKHTIVQVSCPLVLAVTPSHNPHSSSCRCVRVTHASREGKVKQLTHGVTKYRTFARYSARAPRIQRTATLPSNRVSAVYRYVCAAGGEVGGESREVGNPRLPEGVGGKKGGVIEVSMEHNRNEGTGKMGDPRENPPINGIVRHDSHTRKSGVTRPGIEPGSLWWEASRLIAQSPWPDWSWNPFAKNMCPLGLRKDLKTSLLLNFRNMTLRPELELLDVLGRTRAVLKESAYLPIPKVPGIPLNLLHDRNWGLQLLPMNEEFPVIASHKLVLVTSLPCLYTARRYYRLNDLVRVADAKGVADVDSEPNLAFTFPSPLTRAFKWLTRVGGGGRGASVCALSAGRRGIPLVLDTPRLHPESCTLPFDGDQTLDNATCRQLTRSCEDHSCLVRQQAGERRGKIEARTTGPSNGESLFEFQVPHRYTQCDENTARQIRALRLEPMACLIREAVTPLSFLLISASNMENSSRSLTRGWTIAISVQHRLEENNQGMGKTGQRHPTWKGERKENHSEMFGLCRSLGYINKQQRRSQTRTRKLHEISYQTGLQISYVKTQYMDPKSTGKRPLKTQYGKISQVARFKYLGETIQPTGLNTISNTERIVKLQKAYEITWNHYNKRAVSRNAKPRHYNTVVLPEALYKAETTMIRGMTKIHDIEKQERKILTKTHGVVLRDGTWFRRPTKDLYENTDIITDKFRKRRLQFYGHLFRKGEDRLKKNIFNIVNASKSNINCMKETQEDLERLKISEEEIKDRKKFRNRIRNKKIDNYIFKK